MKREEQIAKMLLDIKAVALTSEDKPYIWASGIKSPIYCDNRLTMAYPEIRNTIAESFCEIIKKDYPDTEVIAGTATAGIPHAAWIAQKLELPMIYVRGAKKGHGKENLIEGMVEKGKKVILIEDLISTGGSSVRACEAIIEAGYDLQAALAIFTYGFPAADEKFGAVNIEYKTLTSYEILLNVALKANYLREEELGTLRNWRKDPHSFGK